MSYDKVEQDYNIPKPGDELPTYEDLATQGGPNSRRVLIPLQCCHAHIASTLDSEDGEAG